MKRVHGMFLTTVEPAARSLATPVPRNPSVMPWRSACFPAWKEDMTSMNTSLHGSCLPCSFSPTALNWQKTYNSTHLISISRIQSHPCWWLSASRKPVAVRTHSPMCLYCCFANVWEPTFKGILIHHSSISTIYPNKSRHRSVTRHLDLRAFRRHWSRWQRRQCRARLTVRVWQSSGGIDCEQ